MKKLILIPGVAVFGAMLSGCVVTAQPAYPVVVVPAPPPHHHGQGDENSQGDEDNQGDQQ